MLGEGIFEGGGGIAANYLVQTVNDSYEGRVGTAPMSCELLYFCGNRKVASLLPLWGGCEGMLASSLEEWGDKGSKRAFPG